MEEQLRNILQSSNIWQTIEKNKFNLLPSKLRGKIFTGSLYHEKSLRSFLRSGDNFSLTVETDGFKVFKNGKLSIWPLFCSINEIEFFDKARTTIMSSLWFSNSTKPPFETFLEPCITEARRLYAVGFKWVDSFGVERCSRVTFLILVADAPARSALTNFMQYNGYFGCGFCTSKGQRIRKVDGSVLVFRYRIKFQAIERTKCLSINLI